jgi:hypothetical protein
MIIKSLKKAADLAHEGEYGSELKQVGSKGEGKKCLLFFGITHNGNSFLVPKECVASFDSGPLRKDLEILNGVEFTRKEIEEGIDPEKFIGRQCRILVVHKRTSGGRVVAVVSVLLPLSAGAATQAPSGAVQSPAPAPAAA